MARPDHLGDALLTLPAVATLRRALPDGSIAYLVAPDTIDVPRHCPWVDESLSLPFPSLIGPADSPDWQDIVAREAPLLRGRFDVALLLRPDDPWSGALVREAAVPVRIGYDHPRAQTYLTESLPFPPSGHVAEQAMEICRLAARMGRGLDVDQDCPSEGSYFVPTAQEEAEVERVLAPAMEEGSIGPVVLHPGSGWPLKNWPARRWGQLASALLSRCATHPLIVGSPGEAELIDAVVRDSGGSARGLAGALSLGGLAALHRRARLVVATDSGSLHLAALVGAPVVGLYGPADPRQFGPWCAPDRQRVVRVALPCSPCGTMVDPPCGAITEPACVMGITVEAVLAAVAGLLAVS